MKILESDWQKTVIDLLHLYGYRVCETRKARVQKHGVDVYRTPWGADGKGQLDLIAINRQLKSLIVIENKTENGRLSPEQKEWHDDWISVCKDVYVLRPDNFEDLRNRLEEIKLNGKTNNRIN